MTRRRKGGPAKAVLLLGLGLSALCKPVMGQHAIVEDCLKSAGVPTNELGGSDWQMDSAPFNLRLNYTPIAMATPTTVEHIQDAVACAAKLGIKTNAKCGGHSYASFGLGGEDGHLTIQMDRMNSVGLDPATGIATVQGGARLGHVAYELYTQGRRGFSHGTCPGVGVGGHSLHGGYGMSSHTKGLALDWMVGATVVLANSSVVSCSATEHSELFWAIRGAGSSMGVVAEFQFRTFEVPKLVTYFIVSVQWRQDTATEGLRAMQQYAAEAMPNELNMRLFITRQFANFEGLYWGNKAGLESALAPLLNRTGGRLQFSKEDDWPGQLGHFGNGLNLDQTRPYRMAETFYSSSLYTHALSDASIEAFVDYWFTKGRSTRRDWYVQIDLHGGNNSAVASRAVDSTSYAHRDHLLMFLFYDRVDVRGRYPADGFAFLQGFVGNLTGSLEGNEWGQYVNYPDSTLGQDAAQRSYWGRHLERLHGLKAELDPGDLFHYPQGVQPHR